MTLYTTAEKAYASGICDTGIERTDAMLARRGWNLKTRIPLREVLNELGVSDCVFCFVALTKGGEQEGSEVVRKYMRYICELVSFYFDLNEAIGVCAKALEKRFSNIPRPEMLAQANKLLYSIREDEPDIARRHAINVLCCLTSDKSDGLAAVHAGIALMDAMQIQGLKAEPLLRKKLEELLT